MVLGLSEGMVRHETGSKQNIYQFLIDKAMTMVRKVLQCVRKAAVSWIEDVPKEAAAAALWKVRHMSRREFLRLRPDARAPQATKKALSVVASLELELMLESPVVSPTL